MSSDKKPAEKKKREVHVPHTFIILLGLILVMGILSYIIPAGSYQRTYDEALGREIVDPNSYTEVEKNPMTIV